MNEPMVTLDAATFQWLVGKKDAYLQELAARLEAHDRVHAVLIAALAEWEIDHDTGKCVRRLLEHLPRPRTA